MLYHTAHVKLSFIFTCPQSLTAEVTRIIKAYYFAIIPGHKNVLSHQVNLKVHATGFFPCQGPASLLKV